MSITTIRSAIAVMIAAVSFAFAAAPAGAQPKGGTQSKGCPVEDENGNVSYVPEGTRIGLFRCGSDGEWHFGWLVNARTAPEIHITDGAAQPTRTLN